MTDSTHEPPPALREPPCDHDSLTPCPPECAEAKERWRRETSAALAAMQRAGSPPGADDPLDAARWRACTSSTVKDFARFPSPCFNPETKRHYWYTYDFDQTQIEGDSPNDVADKLIASATATKPVECPKSPTGGHVTKVGGQHCVYCSTAGE